MTGASHRPWARWDGSAWHLAVRVQPGARRSEAVGVHGDELRVRVAGRAVEGKANAELLAYIANALEVSVRTVRIETGHKHRSKHVVVEADVTEAVISSLLEDD